MIGVNQLDVKERMVIMILSSVIIVLLLPTFIRMPFYTADSYDEGWNAAHAERAMRWDNLYEYGDKLITNNYPPISFYFIGLLGKGFGDNVFAGRFVTLVAFIVTALNLAFAVFLMCRDRYISIFSGLLFVALMGATNGIDLIEGNPRFMAHAVMTGAMVVFLRGWERRKNLYFVPILFGLSGFIKHNLIAFPVAVTIFIFLEDRKLFIRWFSYCAVTFALFMGTAFVLYGSAFITSVLFHARPYSIHKLRLDASRMLTEFQLPIAVWFVSAATLFRHKFVRLMAVYVVCSIVSGILFSGGVGVQGGVFFDLVIALVAGNGVALGIWSREWDGQIIARNCTRFLLPLVLLLGALAHVPMKAGRPDKLWHSLKADSESNLSSIEYLNSIDGPALCVRIVLCYWAKKEFEFDPSNWGKAVRVGRKDENELITKLQDGYFSVIQVNRDGNKISGERLFPEIVDSIKQNYKTDMMNDSDIFLVPKE